MNLDSISKELPEELKRQLMSTEKVYYFSFIAFKGGCNSYSQNQNYWLALTERRVMYKTKISEFGGNLSEKEGDLPFEKISFIEVEGMKITGCRKKEGIQLRISTSGGTISIPIPTKEKGYEIRKIYSELSHKQQ